MAKATFSVWRGGPTGGGFKDYATEVGEGMSCSMPFIRFRPRQANDPRRAVELQSRQVWELLG